MQQASISDWSLFVLKALSDNKMAGALFHSLNGEMDHLDKCSNEDLMPAFPVHPGYCIPECCLPKRPNNACQR